MGRCCPVAVVAEANETSCAEDDLEFFAECVRKTSHEGAKLTMRDG